MRLYLSKVLDDILMKKDNAEELLKDAHILHSFAYDYNGVENLYPMCKSIMLDSGAFTVMNSKKEMNNFNPLEYTKKYANHIKQNNIDLFLELDIESVFGFDVYKDCLHCLQDITGKNPIPVFHKKRGLAYYQELTKKYKYIAIGGIAIKDIKPKEYGMFIPLLNTAHKNNCKVHGLGFTSIPNLISIPFDSVDSSSWTGGVRFARPTRFNGHTIINYDCKKTDTKELAHNSIVRKHDFLEWKKLSQYFDNEYEPIW